MQVVLDESAEVLRAERGVLVCVTRHGFVCANAGVDRSNVPRRQVVLLPDDPDALGPRGCAPASRRRAACGRRSLITDSFGRAWRLGQTDVAIGAAGLVPLDDWTGRPDAHGDELRVTAIAVADSIGGRGRPGARQGLARAGRARARARALRDRGRRARRRGAAAPAAEDLFR